MVTANVFIEDVLEWLSLVRTIEDAQTGVKSLSSDPRDFFAPIVSTMSTTTSASIAEIWWSNQQSGALISARYAAEGIKRSLPGFSSSGIRLVTTPASWDLKLIVTLNDDQQSVNLEAHSLNEYILYIILLGVFSDILNFKFDIVVLQPYDFKMLVPSSRNFKPLFTAIPITDEDDFEDLVYIAVLRNSVYLPRSDRFFGIFPTSLQQENHPSKQLAPRIYDLTLDSPHLMSSRLSGKVDNALYSEVLRAFRPYLTSVFV